MRIKLDENIPARLTRILARHGYEADSVVSEGLTGRDDEDVWQASQQTGRFLITQDLDFSDVRKFAPGTHHGILLVRLHKPGREKLFSRLRQVVEDEGLARWARCFVVMTDSKIRVRRPG